MKELTIEQELLLTQAQVKVLRSFNSTLHFALEDILTAIESMEKPYATLDEIYELAEEALADIGLRDV